MKIPANAIISESKLSNYLLAWREEDDKSKFLAQAGIYTGKPERIRGRYTITHRDAGRHKNRTNQYGDCYRVEGELIGSNGHSLGVVTIWILQAAVDNTFRFVTLKPKRRLHDET